MDASKRRKYLRAMGVDVWVSQGADASAAASEATPAAAEAVAMQAPPAPEPIAVPAAVRAPRTAAVPAHPATTEPVAAPAPAIEVPADWDGLRAVVQDCMRCKLCTTRTRTVFGVGPASASLMVVGEGPGADEDAQGEPFVGRAGKLLDEMLAAIGRSRRDNVFIANVVKCRPPGNRDPQPDEVQACRGYLEKQISLVQPKILVALGRVAAQALLGSESPIGQLRGRWHQAFGIPTMVTYHPAALLRNQALKRPTWEDLQQVRDRLRGG